MHPAFSRESYRTYIAAALASVPMHDVTGRPLTPAERARLAAEAVETAECAQGAEEARYMAPEQLVATLRDELAEERVSRAGAERRMEEIGEELRGRANEIAAFDQGTADLVKELWPEDEARDLLMSELAGETRALFARMCERARRLNSLSLALVEGESPRERTSEANQARETLASLEALLWAEDLPSIDGQPKPSRNDSVFDRWTDVASRLLALLEVVRSREAARADAMPLPAPGRPAVSVQALETFLQRCTAKAEAEAEPTRSALLGFVQELAAVMVRECAPAGAELLGGTALVESLGQPLSNGEVPECGAVRPNMPIAASCLTWLCTRPTGHDGQHMSASGAEWEG